MAGGFYDTIPADIRNLTDAQAIERYAAGADLPAKAIKGLTREQLTAFPVPGTWSIQQIVIHLMDSDLFASARMKRAIAEDRPSVEAYDETAFSQRLFYHDLPVADACEIFRRNRLFTAEILRRASADDLKRVAIHSQNGPLSAGQFVRIYIWHLNHHLGFILNKRKMLGAEIEL